VRILLVHNEYGKYSGEEAAFYGLVELLERHGHDVGTFVRRSADLPTGLRGSIRGFVSGIWSPRAERELSSVVEAFRPDLVQVQNLFPLLSASVVAGVARQRIPLVMWCQNYRLFCPTGLMLRNGQPCSACATGGEICCVVHNCEGSWPRSLGYAARGAIARPLLVRHVSRFIVLSQFQKDRFIDWGIGTDRICVIPNFVASSPDDRTDRNPGVGDYVAYVGRVSPEKGIKQLLAAARACPEIPFRVAGHTAGMPDVERNAPENVVFVGELQRQQVAGFLGNARFSVVPSVWYETFGIVVIEAMLQGRPVIASRIGALSNIVDDGITGLHVAPGDAADLIEKVRTLWNQPDRCLTLGIAAREKALREYTSERVLDRFMKCYEGALADAQAKQMLSANV
jgi:glycosyltransferase involved in cell wall biosynthesis